MCVSLAVMKSREVIYKLVEEITGLDRGERMLIVPSWDMPRTAFN